MIDERLTFENSDSQQARFSQFLSWLIPITFFFAAPETAGLVLSRPAASGVGWLTILAYLLLCLTARSFIRQGRLQPAITIVGVALLALDFVGLLIRPAMLPTLVTIPLLVVMIALPYVHGRVLRRLMIACWGVSVSAAVAVEQMPGAGGMVGYLSWFRVGSTAAALGLLLLLVWHFSSQLNETRSATQAANLALQAALGEVHHDSLTALPNRLLLNDRLAQALGLARRRDYGLAVMFLDLDGFKVINDSLGHAAGDEVLRAVAQRLTECVRSTDTVARIGGDEFTLVFPGLEGPRDATRVADKIRNALRQPPFRIEGRELVVTASMGFSLYPSDGEAADPLLRNADAAMYRAKQAGRDRHAFFTPAMNDRAMQSLALERGLSRALVEQEFVVHYQPIVDMTTGRIVSIEALVRWGRPDKGLVRPSEFIPTAEIAGLMSSIGPWVLRTAVRQVQLWRERVDPSLSLAVNLSAREFQEPGLVDQIRGLLNETGLPPASLDLEISEGDVVRNVDAAACALRELKELGVRIAIDDFGIGHSSLGHLRRLPVDMVKIDRSLVRDLTHDPDDASIIAAVIAMAHTLKLQVTAEGVETEEQLAFLAAHHCDRSQGYLFSPPVSSEGCELLLRKRR